MASNTRQIADYRNVRKETHSESGPATAAPNDEGDLGEMLEEVRILLPGAQVLTAFLITLPFSPVFAQIVQSEKWVFTATFLCSTVSLVLFSAPAAQHRLMRPLTNRVRFKRYATREILLGCIALSLALVLSTDLVVAVVLGERAAAAIAALIAVLIGTVWWLLPWRWKTRHNV